MKFQAWDTETALFEPGKQAPPLSCVSVQDSPTNRYLLHWREAKPWFEEQLADPQLVWIAQNGAYDWAVVGAQYPDLLPQIYQLYEQNRVRDTRLRQMLLDIALGTYRGFFGRPSKEDKEQGLTKGAWIPHHYDLDSLVRRHCKRRLDKDTWRLKYGWLRAFPLSKWPAGAKHYPLEDARATWDVYWSQEAIAEKMRGVCAQEFPYFEDPQLLGDEANQCRYAFWIQLMAVWGIRTDPEGVAELEKESREKYEEVIEFLQEIALCPLCSRKLEGDRCLEHGEGPWRLQVEAKPAKGKKKAKGAHEKVFREPVRLVRFDGTRDTMAAKHRMMLVMGGLNECRRTDTGEVSLDRDACEASQDPLLLEYSELSQIQGVVNMDVPALSKGLYLPIHSNFNPLLATGRTSSSKPNLQNPKKKYGIRECFVPREGKVFLDADYDGLELRTLAQVCMTLFGYSKLAEVLNAGGDPHLSVAATLLQIEYAEAFHRRAIDDAEIDDMRQLGKVANFGFPGGLGYETFVIFAWKSAKLKLTQDEARDLKATWFETFEEMRAYFEFIGQLGDFDPVDRLVTLEQLFTKRIRGNIPFTVACNTLFQGLGSDATKNAGWLVSKACYVDRTSPLFGARICNYVHDQFILEIDEDRAHDGAFELARLMVEGAAPYLPDVPPTVSKPVVTRRWSKKASQVWVGDRLVAWDQAA